MKVFWRVLQKWKANLIDYCVYAINFLVYLNELTFLPPLLLPYYTEPSWSIINDIIWLINEISNNNNMLEILHQTYLVKWDFLSHFQKTLEVYVLRHPLFKNRIFRSGNWCHVLRPDTASANSDRCNGMSKSNHMFFNSNIYFFVFALVLLLFISFTFQ